MSTSPIVTITNELLAELEAAADAAKGSDESWYTMNSVGRFPVHEADRQFVVNANPTTIKALLAHIVDLKRSLADADAAHMLYAGQVVELKQQLVAAGITAENCELFRKDAERYQWLRDDAEFADFETLCLTSLDEWGAYIDAARSAGGGS